MKKNVLLTILLWTVILTLFTSTAVGQTLSMKICNKTGYNVDSFSIGNKYVGHFPNDSSILLKFNAFTFDSGYPYEYMRGVVKGQVVEHTWWSWCGSEREQKTAGNFTFDLTLRDNEADKSYLYLDCHRPVRSDYQRHITMCSRQADKIA